MNVSNVIILTIHANARITKHKL